MEKLKFQIFGSKSSIDCDVIVFVDKLSNIDDNHSVCKEYIESLKYISEKTLNVNIGIIKNSKLIDVFKGTTDEVNNSLFYTYDNHKQYNENQILYLYDRINNDEYKHEKILRYARVILSFFSRDIDLRIKIKNALKSDLKDKIEILNILDFNKYMNFIGKKQSISDIYKVIAFQYAQTLTLCNGIETYTKEDMCKEYPKLHNIIYRKQINKDDLTYLNYLNSKFIELCNKEIPKMKKLME